MAESKVDDVVAVEDVASEVEDVVAEAEAVVTVEDVVSELAVPAVDVALEGNLGVVAGLTPDRCRVVLGLGSDTVVTSSLEQEAIRLLGSDPGIVASRLDAERAYKLQSYGNV